MFRFIVNMVYSFQDADYLYLVFNYFQGGNLRYHLNNKKHFSEQETSNNYYQYNTKL